MDRFRLKLKWFGLLSFCGVFFATVFHAAYASDHLDTPTVIADPAADVGDIFAWTSADGKRLNLVMDIVAHQFSNRLQYVLHVDSGEHFGQTTATTLIACRFDVTNNLECWVGKTDYIHGNASNPDGIEGENNRFRVFAGLRNDPFFNNVKGTRAAYNVACAALQHGRCRLFAVRTSRVSGDSRYLAAYRRRSRNQFPGGLEVLFTGPLDRSGCCSHGRKATGRMGSRASAVPFACSGEFKKSRRMACCPNVGQSDRTHRTAAHQECPCWRSACARGGKQSAQRGVQPCRTGWMDTIFTRHRSHTRALRRIRWNVRESMAGGHQG